jgi:hypothetical protein
MWNQVRTFNSGTAREYLYWNVCGDVSIVMHHRIDIRRRIFAGASVILTVLCTPVFVLFLILEELGD